MKVTAIFEDGSIIIDGVAKSGFDFASIDTNWHALQWLGDVGWIEVKQGDRIWLDTDEKVQPFIAMYNADVPATSEAPSTPSSLSPRQLRLVLDYAGLLDQVDAFAAKQERAVQLSWQWATEFRRDDQLLNTMAENMGITQDQIDAMFVEGATL